MKSPVSVNNVRICRDVLNETVISCCIAQVLVGLIDQVTPQPTTSGPRQVEQTHPRQHRGMDETPQGRHRGALYDLSVMLMLLTIGRNRHKPIS